MGIFLAKYIPNFTQKDAENLTYKVLHIFITTYDVWVIINNILHYNVPHTEDQAEYLKESTT